MESSVGGGSDRACYNIERNGNQRPMLRRERTTIPRLRQPRLDLSLLETRKLQRWRFILIASKVILHESPKLNSGSVPIDGDDAPRDSIWQTCGDYSVVDDRRDLKAINNRWHGVDGIPGSANKATNTIVHRLRTIGEETANLSRTFP